MTVQVAGCTEFTECDLSGGAFAARANPLIYPLACTTNAVNPAPDRVRVEIRLTDSQGKVAEAREAVFQCGGAASQALSPAGAAPSKIRGWLSP